MNIWSLLAVTYYPVAVVSHYKLVFQEGSPGPVHVQEALLHSAVPPAVLSACLLHSGPHWLPKLHLNLLLTGLTFAVLFPYNLSTWEAEQESFETRLW